MAFILTNDYHKLIDPNDLTDLLNQYPLKLVGIESFAQEEISTYLRGRYNLSKVFVDIRDYDNLKTYSAKEAVIISDIIYECQIGETIGIDPVTDLTGAWVKRDPRNQTILWCMIVIVIYNLCVAIVPRDIPEIRKFMYYGIDEKQQDGALFLLKSIRDGKNNFDLPLVEVPEIPNTAIRFFSDPLKVTDY